MNHAQNMEDYPMGNPSPGLNNHFYTSNRTAQPWDGMAMPSGEFNHRHARGHFESPGPLAGRSVDSPLHMPPHDFYSEPLMAGPTRSPRNFSVFVSNSNVRSHPAARKDETWQRPKLARPADPLLREVGSPFRRSFTCSSPSRFALAYTIPLVASLHHTPFPV
jgi:hypothetical protein